MQVQTVQGYDLRSFRESIELDKGTYKDQPEISYKQRRLYGIICENQVVWCSQSKLALSTLNIGQYLHKISVDRRDRVAVIDALAWCQIVDDNPRYILRVDELRIRHQVSMSGAVDADAAFRNRVDEFLSEQMPNGPWEAVVKSDVTLDSDQLLLRFPFRFSTIDSVAEVTDEMTEC